MGQTNIIFNIPCPSILHNVHDKSTCNILLLLPQEIKRDIIYKRMNMPPLCTTSNSYPTSHSTSRIPYKGYVHICNTLDSSNTLWPLRIFYNFRKSTLPYVTLHWNTHALHSPSCQDKIFPSPANAIPPMHNLHTQHTYKITKSQECTIYTQPTLYRPL